MKLRHVEAPTLNELEGALEKIQGSCILHSIISKGNSWYAFLLMQEVGTQIEYAREKKSGNKAEKK